MATDLATLLQQIPLAEDGKLITRDYHNSLRAALLALAANANTTPAPKHISMAPTLLPLTDERPPWKISIGIAISDGKDSRGCLPITLRDTEVIIGATIYGIFSNKTPPASQEQLLVVLFSQSLSSEGDAAMYLLHLEDLDIGADGSFRCDLTKDSNLGSIASLARKFAGSGIKESFAGVFDGGRKLGLTKDDNVWGAILLAVAKEFDVALTRLVLHLA